MDILAHGLWTYVAAGTQRETSRLKWLVFFGTLPDLIWLPATAFWLVTTGHLRFSMPLYDVSHSLVVWVVVTFVATLYHHRAYAIMWPWALHILMDIPGHNTPQLLFTPFLWPVSRFTIHGWWDWLSAPWLIVTYVVLAFIISGIFIHKKDRLLKT